MLDPIKTFARAASGAAMLTFALCAPAMADNSGYFDAVQGTWSGKGEIVAGKYKNTRFTCTLEGNAPEKKGMDISGSCRVGLFSQPMNARIVQRGNSFTGTFLDGAKGTGLDIVSGSLRGDKLVVGINRKQLNGQMVANLKTDNRLHITISVKAARGLVPVIGLTLDRTSARKTSMLSN